MFKNSRVQGATGFSTTMRIVKSGDAFTTYRWISTTSSWLQVSSGVVNGAADKECGIRFELYSLDNYPVVEGWWDNFTVHSGQVSYSHLRKRIAVADADGQPCYTEIERWDSIDKEAWLWVKAPRVSASRDTGLKIYFGKERADNETHVGDPGEAPARNVWDEHFMGVWHLSRDPSGGAGSVIDSTARGRHGAPAGLSMENLADGPAGGALYFNGVNEWIDLGDPATFQVASFTLEALFRYDGALADPGRGIVSGYSGGGANQHYGLR
ncbi:MAG: DUF2341 domain-containing protein, partial [Desulfobacterales bacterium]|nr:DUF2341 domain-containing protein [Desulfobacterales bacterium]